MPITYTIKSHHVATTFQGILIIWACSTWFMFSPKHKRPLGLTGNSSVYHHHYHFHIVVEPAGTMFTGAAVDVQRTSHSTEGSIMKREKHHARGNAALYFSNIVFMFLKNNKVNSGISVAVTVVAVLQKATLPQKLLLSCRLIYNLAV